MATGIRWLPARDSINRLIRTARQLRVSNADSLVEDGVFGPQLVAAIKEIKELRVGGDWSTLQKMLREISLTAVIAAPESDDPGTKAWPSQHDMFLSCLKAGVSRETWLHEALPRMWYT